MDHESSSVILAEVILKSKTGQSMTCSDVAITAENVEDFTPAAETVKRATRYLRESGFNIVQSGVTLTVAGRPALFEDTFQVKLTLQEVEATDETPGGTVVHPDAELVVPESLRDVIEKIVFPEPVTFDPTLDHL